MSEVTPDTTGVLGIQLRHATTKHAQSIGTLERCHASLKEALKFSTGDRRTIWHHFVPIATPNYNTINHSAMECEPSKMFHGSVPYNVLDQNFGLKQTHNKDRTTDTGEDALLETRLIQESVSKCVLHTVRAF